MIEFLPDSLLSHFFYKTLPILTAFGEGPATIYKIIRHLKLSFQAEWPPPSHVAHQELLTAAEESGEYL